MADAKYETYLLGTAFARPIIAKKLVEIAKAEGADAICHGCTGKGNDQVRFELAIKRFAPEMKIIAPWREWDIKSRDEEIDYAEAHNVPLKISRETNYSKDKNLWHLSHEGLDLEDPANEPKYDEPGFLEMGVSPDEAPDKPTYVTLDFEKGRPVAHRRREDEGQRHHPQAEQAGRRERHRHHRHRGEPSGRHEGPRRLRDARAAPSSTSPMSCWRCCAWTRTPCTKSRSWRVDFADLIYNGKWYHPPARGAVRLCRRRPRSTVTGTVKLKLYKGNIIPAGTTSPYTPVLRGAGHLRRERSTTRRTPRASSICGVCPPPCRRCGSRVS